MANTIRTDTTHSETVRELGKMAARDPEVLGLLEILCAPLTGDPDSSEAQAFARRASFRVTDGGE